MPRAHHAPQRPRFSTWRCLNSFTTNCANFTRLLATVWAARNRKCRSVGTMATDRQTDAPSSNSYLDKKGIYVKWQCLMNRYVPNYYECVENFKVDIFKIDRVMTRNMSKTVTFHVISALWHGFPIFFYRIWCLKKCYGHFSRSLRKSGLKPCRYCIPISYFWLTYLLDLYDLVIWDDLDLY